MARRGAPGHCIRIKDGRVENHQGVVPTTGNGSPRDVQGNIGAFEASLMNTPMERPDAPVVGLRTLHGFHPCRACSTHVMSPDGHVAAPCACAEGGGEMNARSDPGTLKKVGIPVHRAGTHKQTPIRVR